MLKARKWLNFPSHPGPPLGGILWWNLASEN